MAINVKKNNRKLSLESPQIMGVLNVTPDSFYDGGGLHRLGKVDLSLALKKAQRMFDEGATIIDVGGESTRPGAESVGSEEELARVLPVVEVLCQNLDVIVSVDTSNPVLMRESAGMGAGLINDVRALSVPGALEAAAAAEIPVCLMHMQGQPGSMQDAPCYDSVVEELQAYFGERIQACEAAGIAMDHLILDPGIGFGKTDDHNLELMRRLPELKVEGLPLLVGVSRKSMIGRLLGRELDQRLAGSLALAYAAFLNGASILRVHDVAETRDVLTIFKLLQEQVEHIKD